MRRERDDGPTGDTVSEPRLTLVAEVERLFMAHPLRAVGVAFGVGYALGGGLCAPITARLVGLGLRFKGAALARDLLADLAGVATSRT